jgi:hypothetical protein
VTTKRGKEQHIIDDKQGGKSDYRGKGKQKHVVDDR